MLRAFVNMWRIPELRNQLLFTLAMLVIYRIGFMIPLPFVSTKVLEEATKNAGGSNPFNTIANYMSIFSGGSLKQSTLFGLGIMPYISASIIFQLLATVLPSLQALQKEGPAGQQKIMEWTRLATVPLCLVQAIMWMAYLRSSHMTDVVAQDPLNNVIFWLCGLTGLTAGSIFLMWLGEQIDKYGVGNGVSLIITAGIIDRMPTAVMTVYNSFSVQGEAGRYTPLSVAALAFAFVAVVAGAIIITQGQRRIPIQQAKHTRGRRVYGGQKTYLPLRVNHGGVMPIIFASSLLIFPSMALNYMAGRWPNPFVRFLNSNLGRVEQGYLYILCYIGLIYFFAYFWTTVQFQPKEMATQLRDHGSFIPGLRPGPRTAEYLEVVMERITYVGAGCLAVIAVIPAVVHSAFKVDYQVSAFLGGTGLLIVVSVMLDFVQRIEAGLMMRNYQGFLGSGPRIRGSRGMS
jgi:preprotein translocase subunit SecY